MARKWRHRQCFAKLKKPRRLGRGLCSKGGGLKLPFCLKGEKRQLRTGSVNAIPNVFSNNVIVNTQTLPEDHAHPQTGVSNGD